MKRMDRLPEALRLIRESRGLSQGELAGQIGVTALALSRWERGEAVPDLLEFGRMADLLDLRLGDLDEALVLAGGWPPRHEREPAPPLDSRRLAQQALGLDARDLATEPLESEVAGAFAAVIALARRLRPSE